ncbi:MAG: hypothetical protein AB7F78_22650 [Hyphomicrobiaceae bacterium]
MRQLNHPESAIWLDHHIRAMMRLQLEAASCAEWATGAQRTACAPTTSQGSEAPHAAWKKPKITDVKLQQMIDDDVK